VHACSSAPLPFLDFKVSKALNQSESFFPRNRNISGQRSFPGQEVSKSASEDAQNSILHRAEHVPWAAFSWLSIHRSNGGFSAKYEFLTIINKTYWLSIHRSNGGSVQNTTGRSSVLNNKQTINNRSTLLQSFSSASIVCYQRTSRIRIAIRSNG
jgi:hypothetical protein